MRRLIPEAEHITALGELRRGVAREIDLKIHIAQLEVKIALLEKALTQSTIESIINKRH